MSNQRPALQNSAIVKDRDPALASFMSGTFLHMAAGLGITAAIAWMCSTDADLVRFLMQPGMRLGLFLGILALTFAMRWISTRAGSGVAALAYYAITAAFGLALCWIPTAYQGLDILRAFLMTTCGFLGLALYGYTTKRDLGPMGAFMMMGLFGIIIGGLVNLFLGSAPMAWALSVIGLLVFSGLTAYDVQKIKEMHNPADSPGEAAAKSIRGALELYLDFINLFLYVLRFVAGRR
jgi:FtsH-binding integral membrane protein